MVGELFAGHAAGDVLDVGCRQARGSAEVATCSRMAWWCTARAARAAGPDDGAGAASGTAGSGLEVIGSVLPLEVGAQVSATGHAVTPEESCGSMITVMAKPAVGEKPIRRR